GKTAVFAVLVALTALGAESASAEAIIANRHEVSALYAVDHHGIGPASDAALLPYARQFEKILASCQISSQNLANDTVWMAGQASLPGATRVSSLMLMQAITRKITWTNRRECWDTFDLVGRRIKVAA